MGIVVLNVPSIVRKSEVPTFLLISCLNNIL